MLESSVINQIKKIILIAGDLAAKHHKSELNIKIKSDDSPVTHVDELVSEYIVSELEKLELVIPIISEEGEVPEYEDTFFLIDPIDGTRSYIKGDDDYTVNIGLIENNLPTYGFIYQPARKLLHYTDHNRKMVVEMDGKSIDLHPNNNEDFIVTISQRSVYSEKTQDFIKNIEAANVVLASSSVKLGMIADGSAHLYPRFGLTMEWDIAAGHALILASGGDILCMDGTQMKYGKLSLRNPDFIACSEGYRDIFMRYPNLRNL